MKQTPAPILGMALALIVLIATTAAAASRPGDVDGDGKITVNDAILTLKIVAKLAMPTSDQLLSADVSPLKGRNGHAVGDGTVTVQDAVEILDAVVGLLTLPVAFPSAPPPISAILLPAYANVNVGASTTQDLILPDGVLLSGVITDSLGAPIAGSVALSEVDHRYQGAVQDAVAGYQIGVAPASYMVTLSRSLTDAADRAQGLLSLQYASPDVLSVSADTVKNFTFPATPQLFNVSGTVTAMNATFNPVEIIFTQKSGGPITATRTVGAIRGAYATRLPAGTYSVLVGATITGQTTGSASETLADVTVTGDTTANLVMPLMVKLSGKVAMADGSAVPPSTVIEAIPSGQGSATTVNNGYSGIVQGQYAEWMLPGSYDIEAIQSVSLSGVGYSSIDVIHPGLQITQDQTLDLTLPVVMPVPAAGTLKGHLLDSRGAAVTGPVTVSGLLSPAPNRLGIYVATRALYCIRS